MLTHFHLIGAAALWLAASAAHADPCKLALEANDQLQFSRSEMTVPASCSEIEVTLRNTGHVPAKIMGHDWVLAKDADVPALVDASQSAGAAHGYLPANDGRIIAATPLVGGGESAVVKFDTARLQPGTRYSFFCSFPAHSAMMRGRFVFGGKEDKAVVNRTAASPPTG